MTDYNAGYRAGIEAAAKACDFCRTVDGIKAVILALTPPGQGRAVRVNPLEWDDLDGRGAKASVWGNASYLVTRFPNGEFEAVEVHTGIRCFYRAIGFSPTIEAAKAAAQADYDARILSALQPAPISVVDAENEQLANTSGEGNVKMRHYEEMIHAIEPDSVRLAEAAKAVDLQFQDTVRGYRPPMSVEALIRDLEGYSKCMPSAHRAQNVMAQAAKLLLALRALAKDAP